MRRSCHSVALFVYLFAVSFFSAVPTTSSVASVKADTGKSYVVREIILAGNRITKDYVILRELTFQKGDTLRNLDSTFRRSKENVLNTSLFHTADFTWLADGDDLKVYIILSERWYVFPVPIFEVVDRNFNEWWKTKNFSRVNYGAYLYWNNFRGRNETVTMAIRLGYTQRFSLYYEIPFINLRQKAGLIFAASYSRNKEVAKSTENDTLVYLKTPDDYLRKEQAFSVQYTYRPDLYESHLLEAGFRRVDVTDTVVRANPDFLADGKTREKYFILRYAYRSDHRDYKIYPLEGSYFDAELIKNGFDLLDDDIDLIFVASTYKKFFKLGSGFYAGAAVKGKWSGSAFQPYFNTRALGYGRDFVRGYEYYVTDGQKYGLAKAHLKYELLSQKVVHASFIPFPKFATIPYAFYLNLFADGAYVKDDQFADMHGNKLPNSWLAGYGAGLDFVSYYDIVLSLEYSFNKFGESGIFIHFTASI